MISIYGRPGSHAVKEIVKGTSLVRYRKECTTVVNYGLAGKRLDFFRKKFPSSINKPTINRNIGISKYKMVKSVESIGLPVPDSYIKLPNSLDYNEFIIKKFNSQGGKGIKYATKRSQTTGYYYQRFINERQYELRVHAFSWISEDGWLVQKRIGDRDKIAWNFSEGGKFYTITNKKTKIIKEAINITAKVLKKMDMGFGAADFILDNNNRLFFIEINSAPGFENLSRPYYIDVFNHLCKLDKNKVLFYAT
jgi:glutathione synthase/RimK-type ligase-like ATP-grasp enzyme